MKVLIFGGTHGNEWTGVRVVEKYAECFKEKYPGLDLHFILSNPEAHKLNRRFKDEDLNRAFAFLEEKRTSYEHLRAHEIKQLINESPCFVIDLHTTTSNLGPTVILTALNELTLGLSKKILDEVPDAKIISSPDPKRKYLASQTDHSLMIEVGPVANNLVDGKILEQTLACLDSILNGLSHLDHLPHGEFDVYEEIEDVHYPENSYIHPDFQGQDFIPVTGRYFPFKIFGTGEAIEKVSKKTLFPIFINEAAYYPSKLAFTLCRKTTKNT